MSIPPNQIPDPIEPGAALPVADPFTLPAFLNGPAGPEIPSTKNDRSWALGIHLSGVTCLLVLLPLVLWLVKKETSRFIDDQGKEAVNFGVSFLIVWIAIWVLNSVLHLFFLFPLLWLCLVVLSVIAAFKAYAGIVYRHPFAFRFMK